MTPFIYKLSRGLGYKMNYSCHLKLHQRHCEWNIANFFSLYSTGFGFVTVFCWFLSERFLVKIFKTLKVSDLYKLLNKGWLRHIYLFGKQTHYWKKCFFLSTIGYISILSIRGIFREQMSHERNRVSDSCKTKKLHRKLTIPVRP